MSFPNIPDVDPTINLSTNQAINLVLASIAFEELGLAHILNSEAEKIQAALGTLEGQTPGNPSIGDLLAIDKAVERIIQDVIKEEMLLQFKFENVLSVSTFSSTTTTTATSTTTTSTSTTGTTSSASTTTATTNTATTTTTTTTATTTATTTTTTHTTTSTTSTTTSATSCHPCLTGSGSGDLLPACDARFNRFNIQDPRINASCCEPGNTDPNFLAFRAQLVPSPGGEQSLVMTADLGTLTFNCMGNTLGIMGSGTVVLKLGSGTNKSGPATFTYMFQDNGQQGNQDKIGIVMTGVSDSGFNFSTCGLRSLTGNIIVGSCI